MKPEVREIQITLTDMAKMVNQNLLNHLDKSLNDFDEPLTVSQVQMTVAGYLGMEVGQCASSIEEIEANTQAYARLMFSLASFTFSEKIKTN